MFFQTFLFKASNQVLNVKLISYSYIFRIIKWMQISKYTTYVESVKYGTVPFIMVFMFFFVLTGVYWSIMVKPGSGNVISNMMVDLILVDISYVIKNSAIAKCLFK